MTNVSRMAMFGTLFLGMQLLVAVASAQECPPVAEKVAKAYGLGSFGQIEQIRYTFNRESPGVAKISRRWVWEPNTDSVTYEGNDKAGKPVEVKYVRSDVSGQAADIDPNFLNDQYWLLFPFHLCWDTSAHVEDTGIHKLPLGKGSAERIVVQYPSEGGYSSGDTWALYIGPDSRVRQIVYHAGNIQNPHVVIAKWAEYKQVGPVLISTDQRGTVNGNPQRIYFSDVAVKLKGSGTWINAR